MQIFFNWNTYHKNYERIEKKVENVRKEGKGKKKKNDQKDRSLKRNREEDSVSIP